MKTIVDRVVNTPWKRSNKSKRFCKHRQINPSPPPPNNIFSRSISDPREPVINLYSWINIFIHEKDIGYTRFCRLLWKATKPRIDLRYHSSY